MRAIFVSYRRSDSQGEAGRLFDDLVKQFGDDMVFMDVAGIEAGRDFRKVIEESVAECGVLLVVIGPEWLNAKDERGVRRLDDPGDFVHIETASALRRDIPVVPVLVRGATMPHAEQLPDDLKDLAFRNCCELTHARWRSDIQLLNDALQRLVGHASQRGGKINPEQAMAVPAADARKQKITRTAKPASASSVEIDPATLQHVGRELALHIGPIAEIVVRRAAAGCTSIDDLYLKVAGEIGSQAEREKFLSARGLLSPAGPNPERIAARSANSSGVLPLPALSKVTDEKETVPAEARSSRERKGTPVVVGAGVFVVLLIVVGMYFAARRESNSPQTAPTSGQKGHEAESASPMKSDAAPPVSNDAVNGRSAENLPANGAQGVDGNNPGPTSTTVSKPSTPQRVRVPQDVSAGLVIKKVVPAYPQTARQARVQGTVVLQAKISKDGTVEELREISGHPLLIPAAIDAVKQWQYKPYVVNGNPVPIETSIAVNFTLTTQ